jgi:hypothetical protein
MRITKPLLRENVHFILENVKQAKQYVQAGKLSQDDLEKLIKIDPTPTRKFVGWLAKIWITEKPELDNLANTVEEYNTLLEKGKIKTKDIYQFKSYRDLHSEVEEINNSGEGKSNKELESDYDVVLDNEDLLIMSPHTHEASRKLGLTHFAFRDCGEVKDSQWCTTYKAPDHFNDYYYKQNVTLYYIKVRSQQLIEKLKKSFPENWQNLIVTALVLLPNGKLDGYDGLDQQILSKDRTKFMNLIRIS